MGPDSEKGEILSTWKEIAAYLGSGVRTCIRWEKESGLPVHRQEDAPRSRIFAYKGELDAWFKSRLGNGTIRLDPKLVPIPLWKKPLFWLPALALIAVAAYMMLRESGPKTAAVGPGNSEPQSTGPYSGRPGTFLESEFSLQGALRVWNRKSANAFFEHWRMHPVRHASFAIGDLDGEPELEVAAPAYCRDIQESDNGLTQTKIRFFVNFYKYGHEDWWKTTFYDKSQAVFEKDNFEFSDTAIADIDGSAGNEVVLLTAHGLSVFRFEPQFGEFRLISTQSSFLAGVNTLMRSLVVADVDCDGRNEIVVTANQGEEGTEQPGKGWLLIFRWADKQAELTKTIPLPGETSVHGLKIGHVTTGEEPEAIMACYRNEKGLRNAYIIGWTFSMGFVFDKFVDEVAEGRNGGLKLAVGDLSPRPGDEVLVARNAPNRLISFNWDGSALVQSSSYDLDDRVKVSAVQIGRPRRTGTHSCVLVGGSADISGQVGRTYIELINFSDGFFFEWALMGGEQDNQPVSYAMFVDK